MKNFLSILAAALAIFSAQSIHAGVLHVEVDGIPGDSLEVGRVGQIVADTFQLSFQNRGTFVFSFSKQLDGASVPLMLSGASGKAIKRLTLRYSERVEASLRELYTITLEEVVIESVANSGSSGAGRPSESYSIKFARVKWDYKTFGPDGRQSGTVSAGYNVADAKPL